MLDRDQEVIVPIRIVIVSGGFDPPHEGHLKLFEEAKKLGDMLYVIINNDNWIMKKRKKESFYKEQTRLKLIGKNRDVSVVMLSQHTKNTQDMSVCKELLYIKQITQRFKNEPVPNLIFANGGDRKKDNIPEYKLCEELGIEMGFNVGGEKIESSSALIERVGK